MIKVKVHENERDVLRWMDSAATLALRLGTETPVSGLDTRTPPFTARIPPSLMLVHPLLIWYSTCAKRLIEPPSAPSI